jgi:hypothetical protein
MNDFEEISPLRGFPGFFGYVIATKMSPLRGFLWMGVMPLLQRLGCEAAGIHIPGIFMLLNFSQL